MSRLGSPKGFFDIIKAVSIVEIAKEANRPVSVAVIGDSERRVQAMEALFSGDPANKERVKTRALPESPFIQAFDAMTDEASFPRTPGVFDLVIDLGGGRRDVPSGTPVYSVAELGGWTETLERILDDKPDLALPLARSFPVFRKIVSQRIINQTATANAQFSLLTGITAQFPILAIALPVNSLSDVVILTKNQAMMVLRIAAAHGLSLDYKSRIKEVVPLVGNAFIFWRGEQSPMPEPPRLDAPRRSIMRRGNTSRRRSSKSSIRKRMRRRGIASRRLPAVCERAKATMTAAGAAVPVWRFLRLSRKRSRNSLISALSRAKWLSRSLLRSTRVRKNMRSLARKTSKSS